MPGGIQAGVGDSWQGTRSIDMVHAPLSIELPRERNLKAKSLLAFPRTRLPLEVLVLGVS